MKQHIIIVTVQSDRDVNELVDEIQSNLDYEGVVATVRVAAPDGHVLRAATEERYAFLNRLEAAVRATFTEIVNGEDYAGGFPGLTSTRRAAHIERLMKRIPAADLIELQLDVLGHQPA